METLMTRGKKKLLIWLAIIVAVILLVSLSGMLPQGSVLVLEVNGELEEQKGPGVLAELSGSSITVVPQMADAIRFAKDDDRIRGLVLKISGPESGWAKLQELRGAVADFRKSGKPTICYLSSDIPDNGDYYLATACEQVWLVPTATLGITGMRAQALFIRGTLEKLGIFPDFYGFHEYKTARDFYTEKKYTAANREMSESLIRSIYAQFLADVAAARKMEKDKLDALVRKGPFLTSEALAEKLVDRAAYWDEVQTFFKEKNEEWRPVGLNRYSKEIVNLGGEKIAVVHATGAIVVGESTWTPATGFVMGSDSVAADLRSVRQDPAVKAVILRVDSPGGSAVASEIIRREVVLTKKEKPVIVSMSDVAGSGGYWISMSADRILADPSTITASIGVVFGKMNVSGFYNLLGLSTDSVATSDNAYLWNEQRSFSPEQRETIRKFMREIYTNFTQGVADGRKMKLEAVEKIAKGRVWTGEQAKGLGLVDEVGGFDAALAEARKAANLAADAKVEIVRYPAEKPWWQALLGKDDSQTILLRAVSEEIRRARSLSNSVQARMPVEYKIR